MPNKKGPMWADRQVWIGRGTVTDLEGRPEGTKIGDDEWQFSDGPAGDRSYSEDFLTLIEGLREFTGFTYHWEDDNLEDE